MPPGSYRTASAKNEIDFRHRYIEHQLGAIPGITAHVSPLRRAPHTRVAIGDRLAPDPKAQASKGGVLIGRSLEIGLSHIQVIPTGIPHDKIILAENRPERSRVLQLQKTIPAIRMAQINVHTNPLQHKRVVRRVRVAIALDVVLVLMLESVPHAATHIELPVAQLMVLE